MSEIIVKPPPEKKGTGRDPILDYGDEHRLAQKLGAERAAGMIFENDGERKDYERAVRSNPNNVYGLPKICMFPEMKLSFSLTDLPGEPAYSCECGFRAIFKAEKCVRCGRPVVVPVLAVDKAQSRRLIAELILYEDVARSIASQLRVIFNGHASQAPIVLVVSEAIYDALIHRHKKMENVFDVPGLQSTDCDCTLYWDPAVLGNAVKVYTTKAVE